MDENKKTELKDTVSGMVSGDWVARFQAEYQQVKIRVERLRAMICDWVNGTLNFEPNTPIELLMKQLEAMEQYMTLLEVRAAMENIEI